MDSMHDIAKTAIDQAPPECRVRPEDADVIQRHADALVGLGPEMVNAFYDTVYGHSETEKIFKPGERPMREESLQGWWERTVRGPLDDDYWAWMALVGLTHVIRRVNNPMMLAMANFVAQFVESSESLEISDDERRELSVAFRRVSSTVSSIITFAYDHAVSSALFSVAGMPEALLARLRDQEVGDALDKAHKEVRSASRHGS